MVSQSETEKMNKLCLEKIGKQLRCGIGELKEQCLHSQTKQWEIVCAVF